MTGIRIACLTVMFILVCFSSGMAQSEPCVVEINDPEVYTTTTAFTNVRIVLMDGKVIQTDSIRVYDRQSGDDFPYVHEVVYKGEGLYIDLRDFVKIERSSGRNFILSKSDGSTYEVTISKNYSFLPISDGTATIKYAGLHPISGEPTIFYVLHDCIKSMEWQ